jgi:tRNA(fMet)-specific endonuclease VapC
MWDRLEGGQNAVTTISEMEIWYGQERSNRAPHPGIDALFNGLVSLSFDSQSAKMAGKISAQLAAKGLEIGVQDVMIAAIAMRHDATLYTRNIKHFGRISGLKIKRW